MSYSPQGVLRYSLVTAVQYAATAQAVAMLMIPAQNTHFFHETLLFINAPDFILLRKPGGRIRAGSGGLT